MRLLLVNVGDWPWQPFDFLIHEVQRSRASLRSYVFMHKYNKDGTPERERSQAVYCPSVR